MSLNRHLKSLYIHHQRQSSLLDQIDQLELSLATAPTPELYEELRKVLQTAIDAAADECNVAMSCAHVLHVLQNESPQVTDVQSQDVIMSEESDMVPWQPLSLQAARAILTQQADTPSKTKHKCIYWWNHADFELPPNRSVIALIDDHSNPKIWIAASVVAFVPSRNKYQVVDEDKGDETHKNPQRKHYYLDAKKIIPLAMGSEEYDPLQVGMNNLGTAYEFKAKDRVLAMFPGTTVFYPAIVVTERKAGFYHLKFEDDDVTKSRRIDARQVVPLPLHIYNSDPLAFDLMQ